MVSITTITTFFLLLVLSQSAPPCNPKDPKSLCLTPLRSSKRTQPDAETLSPTLRRRGGRGGGGGRRGGFGGTAAAAATGAVIGSAIGGSRRRPRPGRVSFGDDDDDFEDQDGDLFDDDDDDDDDFCFPATAIVTVKGKGHIQMRHLQLSDSVLTTTGYSPVFLFTHRVTRGQFPFVKITTPLGALTLSKGHYIYASGALVTADSLNLGDIIDRGDGQLTTITAIENVIETGLYNPHTLTGHLIVDGFHVSAYTKTVQPIAANALLAPIRAAFRFLAIDITSGAFVKSAPKSVLNRLPKGSFTAEL